ncbi:cortistatin isoform X1 [Canis aureus]
MAGLAAPWPAGSAHLCPPVWVSGAGASRGRGGLGAPVPRPPRRVPPRSPRVAHVAPAAAARVRQVRSPLCGRLWGAGRPGWRLRRAPEGRGRGPSRRVKERAARWAEGPAAPPRGPGPAVPRLLRPGRPLARRLPGACSPRVPGTGRAAPRRPSAPARAAELGPQEPPARTCPRAGPPQPPPDAARWLRALDVITLSAVRAPDFVSICRKEVIELKKSLMTFLAGWSQWIPPGRCSALLRRGSRGGTRVAAGPPTQRSLQEKAPCKVFWKTSSRKENSTPDYPYKEL